MAMGESKDLNKMKLHDLFDDLKSYEFEINSRNEDRPSTSTITKALMTAEETVDSTVAKSTKQLSNNAISLFVKKFGKFLKKNNFNSNFNKSNNRDDSKANLKSFNCDKPGHFKEDYRKPKRDDKKQSDKRNRKEQKALLTKERKSKWVNSESNDNSSRKSENEDVKYLMEDDNEVFDFSSDDFTRDDLIIALNDMVIEYKKLSESFNDIAFKSDKSGIRHELFSARIPQQNGVAKRRNRTLKEVVRSMIDDSGVSQKLWAEAINTAYPGIILGHSSANKAYRVYNKKTLTVEESTHIVFDEFVESNSKEVIDVANRLEAANLQSDNDEEGQDKFEMSMMGELTFFLGLQVQQLEARTFINQEKYTKELLKKFNMENCSTASTPMDSSKKLDKDEDGQSVDITVYRGIISSLLYQIASRSDILFTVGVCGHFQANPK
ncbi:uncharacterized protein LOC124943211 [Impatiens glandulifera]|uniref:uncharacterized protein LOC124943211 n=1 Tax=Impatiens glandulifera TaxID=253017 RepID=UPI001FB11948|nr:uncharacterized protein LOC124943211 [Impatiens glandulifera]